MKKRIIYKNTIKNSKILFKAENSIIVELKDGSILKVFEPTIIKQLSMCGFDIEKKILDATPIKNSPEIIVPSAVAYFEDGNFMGYTMPKAKGINFNDYDKKLTIPQRKDLKKYAIVHSKIESVLRRNKDIVFPDLCTCDNLFIDKNNNIQFIDYDGLQVGPHSSLSISTSLGKVEDILGSPKYLNKEQFLFTKELDKRSSIILYFLSAFNINLTKVGQIHPSTGEIITLEEILHNIDLTDDDICHKVWKIFQDDVDNEYLGDDVFKIAEMYDLDVFGMVNGCYLKKLSKK